MPTPLGHALVGLGAGGLAAAMPPARFARSWGWAAAFAGMAVLPDLDHALHPLLPALAVRGPTHSYAAAVAAALIACAAAARGRHGARVWPLLPFLALAVASHGWMDYHEWIWANGVQLYWPFDAAFYTSGPPALFPTKAWLAWPPSYVADLLWTDFRRFAWVALGPWLVVAVVRQRDARQPRIRKTDG